ncbi:hypothetical protein [Bartonella sp. DGB2]
MSWLERGPSFCTGFALNGRRMANSPIVEAYLYAFLLLPYFIRGVQ